MFSRRHSALAQAVCATCSVAGRCLVEALAEERGLDRLDRYGVRGGLAGAERAALARGAEAGVGAFKRFARRRAAAVSV